MSDSILETPKLPEKPNCNDCNVESSNLSGNNLVTKTGAATLPEERLLTEVLGTQTLYGKQMQKSKDLTYQEEHDHTTNEFGDPTLQETYNHNMTKMFETLT